MERREVLGVDCVDEVIAKPQVVNGEVDFEQLDDHKQTPHLLGH